MQQAILDTSFQNPEVPYYKRFYEKVHFILFEAFFEEFFPLVAGILLGGLIILAVIVFIGISIESLFKLLATDKPKQNQVQVATKAFSEQTRLQIEKEILQEMWNTRVVREKELTKERKS